ncbi:MAG: adenine phosphoribosyltransferase [Myxococcota bacterium]
MTDGDPRLDLLRSRIRDVPDFPKPGILFKDITPLVGDGPAFQAAVDLLAESCAGYRFDRIVAIESRGFVFGGALAARLGLPMAMVRKPGKLPYRRDSTSYALEYGEGTLELHVESVRRGERCLILDDVLATGGTARAAATLAEGQGGRVEGYAFVIELDFLAGRGKLADKPVFALLHY